MIRRLLFRRVLNGLCAEAVKIHRILDRHPVILKEDRVSDVMRFELLGRLYGIQESMCILMGWDTTIDADKEGRADETITDWWEKHYPEEWDG